MGLMVGRCSSKIDTGPLPLAGDHEIACSTAKRQVFLCLPLFGQGLAPVLEGGDGGGLVLQEEGLHPVLQGHQGSKIEQEGLGDDDPINIGPPTKEME